MKSYQAIDLLSRPNGVTIRDFQNRLNISRRSVYRLLDRLQEEGFPIYQDDTIDRQKRWKLQEGYLNRLPNISLPDLSLDRREIILLNLMLGAEDNLDDSGFLQVRRSLRAKLNQWLDAGKKKEEDVSHGSKYISAIKTGRKSYIGSEQILDDLLSAIGERRVCRGLYYAYSRREELQFDLRPVRIFEWQRGLYIFCLLEPELPMRMLALERFRTLEKTDRTFPRPEVNPEKLMQKAFSVIWDDPISVKIRFSDAQAPYVKSRRWSDDQVFEDQNDGSTILSMITSGTADVLHWVLGFGAEAHVLEPASLAEDVADQLDHARSLYQR